MKRLRFLFLEYRLARDLGYSRGKSARFAWRYAILWRVHG